MLSKAAYFYGECADYQTSLRLYLRGGTEEDINDAIDVVGKARNDVLTHCLIDYLMGDATAINATLTEERNRVIAANPKDPQYVYRLHKALGNYDQAAKTALIIAKQQQDQGNYKNVHDLLFSTFRDMQTQNLPIPLDLYKKLVLLHSYVIVKRIAKSGDHLNAAHMLLRVATRISEFPEHLQRLIQQKVPRISTSYENSNFCYTSDLMFCSLPPSTTRPPPPAPPTPHTPTAPPPPLLTTPSTSPPHPTISLLQYIKS